MQKQSSKALHLRLLIGGIVAILLGSSGIAAVKAWIPASSDIAAVDKAAVDEAPALRAGGDRHARPKCEECGVIESTREIRQAGDAEKSAAKGRGARGGRSEPTVPVDRHYEVTVRMKDGASHVFFDANPANWRPGERVTLIAGASQSSD